MTLAASQQLFIYEVTGLDGDPKLNAGDQYLGCWVEGVSGFLFFTRNSDSVINGLIARNPGLTLCLLHQLTYGQWQAGQDLAIIKSPPLVVVPTGKEYFAHIGEKVIELDPGLVFGAGDHPTTSHCLAALVDAFLRSQPETVLDLGCGTGILALAAAKLGAKAVLAVDLNPLCVTTTLDNVRQNDFHKTVEVVLGDAVEYARRPADMVLANLTADVLMDALTPRALVDKRAVIVSGLMRSRAGQVRRRLITAGLTIQSETEARTWVTIHARRT